MIIVSQDRKMLINFNSIVSVYVIKNCVSKDYVSKEDKGYNIDFATNEEINFVLATYKTEERAREVLQEIIKAYRDYRTAECDGYTNVLQETAVFEMQVE